MDTGALNFISNPPFHARFVRRRRWAAGWLLLVAACGLHAGRREEYAGESAKWSRYQSPHFELFSANDDHASREILHNLELLRALFFENFKLKERQPLEVSVYYFHDKEAFFNYVGPSLRKNENIAGYYMSQPDRATIVVSPAWDDESARHVIFHEYIHHLIRISGEEPPLWYNEGVAELYSSIEIGAGSLEIGKPLPWHILSLRQDALFPLEQLFSIDASSPVYNTGTHSGQFYAEAWALLHYWFYGSSQLDHEKIRRFMNFIRNEAAPADPAVRRSFFREMMGMDYPAMQERLEHYARNGSYSWKKIPLPQIAGTDTYQRAKMTAEETRGRLTELDLRANQSGRSRLALLRAADRSPLEARTWEVLGADAWSQGEPDVARDRWAKALEVGTNNSAIYHEMGLMESRRWFGTFDYYFEMPAELAKRLRLLLKRSIEYAPEQSDAYEMLAWIEATVVKPDLENVALVEKHFATLVHKGPTLTALALVSAHSNDRRRALMILDQAEATKPGSSLANVIRIIRSHLQPAGEQGAGEMPAEASEETEIPQSDPPH